MACISSSSFKLSGGLSFQFHLNDIVVIGEGSIYKLYRLIVFFELSSSKNLLDFDELI